MKNKQNKKESQTLQSRQTIALWSSTKTTAKMPARTDSHRYRSGIPDSSTRWNDFHKQFHSQSFHYSAGNEDFMQQNLIKSLNALNTRKSMVDKRLTLRSLFQASIDCVIFLLFILVHCQHVIYTK